MDHDAKITGCFSDPDLTAVELEDWLNQQARSVGCFNRLISEKAALEKRLKEIGMNLDSYASLINSEKLSLPWRPTPHPEYYQKND